MTDQRTNLEPNSTGRAVSLSWDWKSGPDPKTLARVLRDLAGLHVQEVDNGMDDITVVISTVPVDAATATAVWENESAAAVDLDTLPTTR